MNSSPGSVLAFRSHQTQPNVDYQNIPVTRNAHRGKIYSDKAVVDGLKARDFGVIRYLYRKYFHEVCIMVIKNSGTMMDAEDIFQDVLVILYKKSTSGSLVLTSSFNTYLYSVSRHLWFQQLSHSQAFMGSKEFTELDVRADDEEIQELLKQEQLYELFREHFSRLSDDDQKVLNLYMGKTSAKEVACIMGYKSENYAKYRKYLCKEKLKNSIINDPRFQEY